MKAAITGANGFIGAALARRLCDLGWDEIRCLVREGSDLARLGHETPRLSLVTTALHDPACVVAAIHGCEVVFHLAASLRGAPADMFRDAVVTTRNLLDAALALPRPPRVVLVSSLAVYGTARPIQGATLDERTPLEPEPMRRDAYAQAKLRQEQLAWSYHRDRALPLVVVRPGVVYGPGRSPVTARVGFRAGGAFLLLGCENLVPLCQVDNCADAIALCGTRGAVGVAYNAYDDELVAGRELARRLARRDGLLLLAVPPLATRAGASLFDRLARRAGGRMPAALTPYGAASLYSRWRFDNGLLRSLGWRQRVPTAQGLAAAFA